MKKFIFLLIALLLSILTACGNPENAGDTNSGNKKEDADLKIIDSTGAAWIDSIGSVWVHSAAVFKNTGSAPVKIDETQIKFKGQDGSILGSSSMIYPVPDIIMPGEKAYIEDTTLLDSISSADEYKETTYKFNFDETNEEPNSLEVSGVSERRGLASSPYSITGVVKNTTDELQDDIRLAAGLYDSQGKLLGVLKGRVDVGVNSGSEAGFELSNPDIPEDITDQVETVDVKAYGWTW